MSTDTSLNSLSMHQKSSQHRKSFSTSTATKLKIAIGVVLALAVVATVGVCAAIFVPRATIGEDNQGDASIDMETKAKLLDMNKDVSLASLLYTYKYCTCTVCLLHSEPCTAITNIIQTL